MSMGNEGTLQGNRSMSLTSSYIPNENLGSTTGGGTYTSATSEPTIQDFENVFGPSARNMKDDPQRYKRHGRWHLPDILKGPNPWLADRVDGLITDATNSPFTTTILPYKYFENVDGKIKWNVWSMDEGMSSRVPYESAARTLTQSKRSFSAYALRHGLAITLEHNFMMTPKGRENFQNQLTQLVGSIQYSNDYDVHMALITAPSYEKYMIEKYNNYNKSPMQSCREFIDLFGFMQKNPNALDILIEEAKLKLKLWGGPMPNFMLTNSKITFQLTMTPERTNYISQGPDGVRRLKQGPSLSSYRGISIIPSRSFSLETGQPPRDMMRRRVRVAEYYRIIPHEDNLNRLFEFYNEERDTFFSLGFTDLLNAALIKTDNAIFFDVLKVTKQDEKLIKEMEAAFKRRHSTSSQKSSRSSRKSSAYSDTITLAPLKKSLKQVRDWSEICESLSSGSSSKTAIVTPDKYIASWINRDTIFVPFLGNLHFEKKDSISTELKKKYKNLPEHVSNALCNSAASYPREVDVIFGNKKTLRNPFTMEMVHPDTIDHRETVIALNRLCQRYAAPTSYLTKIGPDKIAINVQAIRNKDKLHVGDMFYQPLGAFTEPNHPFFHESIIGGNCKDVHESWILTEEVLDHLYKQPDKWQTASKIATALSGQNMSRAQFSLAVASEIESQFTKSNMEPKKGITKNLNAYTWGVQDDYITSLDYLNPTSQLGEKYHMRLKQHAPNGIVTNAYLQKLVDMGNQGDLKHPWLQASNYNGNAQVSMVQKVLANRLTQDAYHSIKDNKHESVLGDRLTSQLLAHDFNESQYLHTDFTESLGTCDIASSLVFLGGPGDENSDENGSINITENDEEETDDKELLRDLAKKTEFVIIRPNIEHHMIGIILGESGDSLGNTLWGQTELAVHDDSQHGVWGMQYKYHEKAIVFNERNLIRLWDIAYDGYNGGKDDTYVNWVNDKDVQRFKEHTLDVTKDYHGKSMMVMAFVHDDNYHVNRRWKVNWPSPILFYDHESIPQNDTVANGSENETLLPVHDFRVFDEQVYPMYKDYRAEMPNFYELHKSRKTSSESAEENETQASCLAFQGTMRIKTTSGALVDTINGSGHHGVDYVGVASVRAGKGYKQPNGISAFVRQI